jgi:4-amino-4-deoxy-L-arabinose transferase-like glycosyltransferase
LLVVWAVLAVVALAWGIGDPPLADPDEGRTGEVAREMAASNDYVLPHINGLPYIDKPLLHFAATAAVMELLGPTEIAARLVPFLCFITTTLIVGLAAGRWYGFDAGWVAGIAAALAPLPLAFSRIAILDGTLSLLVTTAVLALHTATEARTAKRTGLAWTLVGWFAIGLGILTKGPVAVAVPLMIVVPYAIWRRASWAVWNPLGPLTAIAIVTPWVVFMERKLPGYLHYVAITETWQRVASDELNRSHAWWYFLAIAGVGFFPWWLLIGGRRSLTGGRDPHRVFAVLWLLIPLVFFSLSRSKLPQYILPLAPAVALLVAAKWSSERRLPRLGATTAVIGWGLLGTTMAAVAFGALDGRGVVPPELLEVSTVPAMAMAAVCALSVLWGIAALRGDRPAWLITALSLPVVVLPIVLRPVIVANVERRSERSLVEFIRTELPAETEVVGLQAWRPSVPFYLRQPIPVYTETASEIRSNYLLRTRENWIDPIGLLRPMPERVVSIADCGQPRVVLVHAKRQDLQAVLEGAGLERVWTGPKLHAFFCDPDAELGNIAEPTPEKNDRDDP